MMIANSRPRMYEPTRATRCACRSRFMISTSFRNWLSIERDGSRTIFRANTRLVSFQYIWSTDPDAPWPRSLTEINGNGCDKSNVNFRSQANSVFSEGDKLFSLRFLLRGSSESVLSGDGG